MRANPHSNSEPATLVSTTGFARNRSLSTILTALSDGGITAVELGTTHAPERGMRDMLLGYNVEYSVHNYFPMSDPELVLNISSPSDRIRTASIGAAKRGLDIGASINAHFYGLHAGFLSDVSANSLGKPLQYGQTEGRSDAIKRMLDSAAELCTYAAEREIPILFENHVLAPFNVGGNGEHPLLLVTADDIVEFFSALDMSNAGLLLDLGHLKVTAKTLDLNRLDFVCKVKPWIKALHLSDNNGFADQTAPFGKQAWFASVIKELGVHCVIESNFRTVECAKRMVDQVKEWRGQRPIESSGRLI